MSLELIADGNLLSRMRMLEVDHEPDGYPAVRMIDITAMCDCIVKLQRKVVELGDDRDSWVAQNEKRIDDVLRLADEIKHLRAALEKIANTPTGWAGCAKQAKDALSYNRKEA